MCSRNGKLDSLSLGIPNNASMFGTVFETQRPSKSHNRGTMMVSRFSMRHRRLYTHLGFTWHADLQGASLSSLTTFDDIFDLQLLQGIKVESSIIHNGQDSPTSCRLHLRNLVLDVSCPKSKTIQHGHNILRLLASHGYVNSRLPSSPTGSGARSVLCIHWHAIKL